MEFFFYVWDGIPLFRRVCRCARAGSSQPDPRGVALRLGMTRLGSAQPSWTRSGPNLWVSPRRSSRSSLNRTWLLEPNSSRRIQSTSASTKGGLEAASGHLQLPRSAVPTEALLQQSCPHRPPGGKCGTEICRRGVRKFRLGAYGKLRGISPEVFGLSQN